MSIDSEHLSERFLDNSNPLMIILALVRKMLISFAVKQVSSDATDAHNLSESETGLFENQTTLVALYVGFCAQLNRRTSV